MTVIGAISWFLVGMVVGLLLAAWWDIYFINSIKKTKMKTPKKILAAARGENCTFAIPSCCNHDPATVVACHLPDGSGGSSRLTGPLSFAFGCSSCHDAIDRRKRNYINDTDREFFMRRAQTRTINRLINLGLVKIG